MLSNTLARVQPAARDVFTEVKITLSLKLFILITYEFICFLYYLFFIHSK